MPIESAYANMHICICGLFAYAAFYWLQKYWGLVYPQSSVGLHVFHKWASIAPALIRLCLKDANWQNCDTRPHHV